MAKSDSNNSASRGATRSALVIVGVLALLGLAYAIARVDILRARIVTQEISMGMLQESNNLLRGQVASLATGAQDSSKQIAQLQTELGNLSSNFGELHNQAEQAQRLSARSEALYLLRLANDQLQLAHDLPGAIDTLSAAEALLLSTHDALLDGVLRQVQTQLQQLRARPGINTGLIQQQLAAAEQLAGSLPLAGIGLQDREDSAVLPDTGLTRAWALLKRSMNSLFSVRKTSGQSAALLTSDEQILRRRHLQLVLLNARLALHAHDQSGYASALQDAVNWLDQAFNINDPAVSGLRQQLQQLAGHDIAPAMQDLSPSIQALSRYIPAAASRTDKP
jgi:uroporphyrin-III C-methyltransferase